MIDNLRVLILAAGKSTRMNSKYAKVLHRVGGATLIEHVLRAARSVSTDITIVIGNSAEKVRTLARITLRGAKGAARNRPCSNVGP